MGKKIKTRMNTEVVEFLGDAMNNATQERTIREESDLSSDEGIVATDDDEKVGNKTGAAFRWEDVRVGKEIEEKGVASDWEEVISMMEESKDGVQDVSK